MLELNITVVLGNKSKVIPFPRQTGRNLHQWRWKIIIIINKNGTLGNLTVSSHIDKACFQATNPCSVSALRHGRAFSFYSFYVESRMAVCFCLFVCFLFYLDCVLKPLRSDSA